MKYLSVLCVYAGKKINDIVSGDFLIVSGLPVGLSGLVYKDWNLIAVGGALITGGLGLCLNRAYNECIKESAQSG